MLNLKHADTETIFLSLCCVTLNLKAFACLNDDSEIGFGMLLGQWFVLKLTKKILPSETANAH